MYVLQVYMQLDTYGIKKGIPYVYTIGIHVARCQTRAIHRDSSEFKQERTGLINVKGVNTRRERDSDRFPREAHDNGK